jgi:hypothetical protein
MKTKQHLTEAEAIEIVEDDSTQWTLIPDEGDAEAIRQHVELRALATAGLDDAVIRARRHGMTWMEIGAALGVSHQAARKKYAGRV